MSARPRTVEFVLMVDTAHRSRPGEAERVGEMIRAQVEAESAPP
jgi:pyrimidine operon attenuation protein/uracil phosphoribosyltransferase